MDMRHMEYLQHIADLDVQHLQEKEKTYKGSWKRRGGVGAFMMLARKWDRLEEMSARRIWDIFMTPGSGEDGTPLAEIRDLRRYLLLVEAELLARRPQAQFEEEKIEPPSIKTYGPYKSSTDFRLNGPGIEERQVPRFTNEYSSGAKIPMPEVLERLDDGLRPGDVTEGQRRCYREVTTRSGTLLIVDRPKVPEEMWAHLPRLRTELNDKEYQETAAEYQTMYRYNANDGKWTMQPEFVEHWSRQP